MRYKLTFAIGAAAGYVLGSRAGRQRYEQIAALARDVKENPTVQEAAGVVQARASAVAGEVAEAAKAKAGEAINRVTSTVGHDGTPGGSNPSEPTITRTV